MVLDVAMQAATCHSDLLPMASYVRLPGGVSSFLTKNGALSLKAARKEPLTRKIVWSLATTRTFAQAVTMGEFAFRDEHRCPLHGQARERARYVAITWRTQKNNINGQTVTFGRTNTAYLCPVRAAWTISLARLASQHGAYRSTVLS